MIELSDDWVLCHDDQGNPAYFPYNKIHSDYKQDDYVMISADEFMDMYNRVDSTFDDSYDTTYYYFKNLHTGKDVDFEEIHISKEDLTTYVFNALWNDKDRIQVFLRSYEDWEFLVSLDNVMDNYFICDYTVDQILGELSIPDVYTLQMNYETDDLQFDDEEIPSIKKK